MKFEQLGLRPELVRALQEMGITEPTDIQGKAIPPIKEGKDVIVISKTGSGKTAAFGLPMLESITPHKGLQGIILAPTRELAVQISQELQKFAKFLHFRFATIYGGVSLIPQVKEMERADILVGTPGRVLDHLKRRNLDLTKIRCAVLDEADKMVEMGFIEDITEILQSTPEYRQMVLLGATISTEIEHLQGHFMHDPVTVEAERQVKEEYLQQYYYNTERHEKFSLLVHLLKKEKPERAIIFCSARHTVELITRNLRRYGFGIEMIHGKLSQNRRLQVIDAFHKGKIPILVASAVAARGLHIEKVTHIINEDLAQAPQEYIHRVGRTARAGESGKAFTLLERRDYDVFDAILRRYRVKVEEMPPENFQRLQFDARREEEHRRPQSHFRSSGNFQGRRAPFRRH